jgi:multicomponent Na+:H+ antiporter subunit B
MKSLILETASKLLLPLLLLFSFFLLIRGHNEPGGGFVGGLAASAAFALYTIANGVKKARITLQMAPGTYIAIGLILAGLAGTISLFSGDAYMTSQWLEFEIKSIGKISTPLFFDIGVYFVVFGVTLTIVFSLAEK